VHVVHPEEVQVLDLVQARGGERHPQPAVLTPERDHEHGEADPHECVGHEVHRLEVELPEHTVRVVEVPACRRQLEQLDRVLTHVEGLEESHPEEDREHAVALVLPDRLDGERRDPGNQRREGDDP
jgi:hypothetical protein